MKKTAITALLTLVILSMFSCEPEGLFDTEITTGKIVSLKKGIAIHELGMERILYLEAGLNRADLSTVYQAEDGERILWIKGRRNLGAAGEIFALSAPEDERDTKRSVVLLRIAVDSGTVRKYYTGSRFDNLSFGPSGRYLVLYHSGNNESSEESLYNPNEVAIVDLAKEPGPANPRIVSIGIDGRKIASVSFADTIDVGGKSRRLVIFMAEGSVKMLDMADPGLRTLKVELTTDNDTRTVVPVQAMARQGDDERYPMIFVRAEGSRDIYGISLFASEDDPSGFTASLNQYDGGDNPLDMVLADDGNNPLLVVLSGSKSYSGGSTVNVIHIDTADVFSIELADSTSSARLVENDEGDEIVFYGDSTSGIHFLKVNDLSEEKGSNLEHKWMPENVGRAVLLDSERLLVIPEQYQDLIMFNIRTKKLTRLSAGSGYDFNGAQIALDRFFLVPESADRIDTLDLTTGHPASLLMDDRIDSLHLLEGSGAGLAFHDTPTGRISIFPLDNPVRSETFVIDGLWLDGFLEETEVEK